LHKLGSHRDAVDGNQAVVFLLLLKQAKHSRNFRGFCMQRYSALRDTISNAGAFTNIKSLSFMRMKKPCIANSSCPS